VVKGVRVLGVSGGDRHVGPTLADRNRIGRMVDLADVAIGVDGIHATVLSGTFVGDVSVLVVQIHELITGPFVAFDEVYVFVLRAESVFSAVFVSDVVRAWQEQFCFWV